MREKMSKTDRAKQFLPFNSLRGFYLLIDEANKSISKEERKILTKDEIERISYKIQQLKPGMMVDVKYYDHKNGGYRTIKGMVAEIDFVYKILTIVDNKIAIKDIFDINGEEITEFDDFLND